MQIYLFICCRGFTSSSSATFNIYAVADLLNERGWNLNSLQNPNASVVFSLILEFN